MDHSRGKHIPFPRQYQPANIDHSRKHKERTMTPYTLKQFIDESDAILRDQSSESHKLAQLKPRLEQLIQSYSVPDQAFTPRQDRFAMNLLHMPLDKAYSIIGGVWKP